MQKTKELKSLALLWIDLVDTLDADDKGKFRLSWDVVGAFLLGDAREADLLALGIAVLLDVRLGALEDLLALLLVLLGCELAHCCVVLQADMNVALQMFSPERWLTNDNIAQG